MQHIAGERIKRAFPPDFLKSLYAIACEQGRNPDALVIALYGLYVDFDGDYDSALKAAECLLLDGDTPLVDSCMYGSELPKTRTAREFRELGIDVTDDEVGDCRTLLELDSLVERRYCADKVAGP